jgi:translation elongation factor P/translation initiation factor 5A
MGKILAKNVAKGTILILGGERITVTEVEHSDIAKQGTKKTRIVGKKASGETVTIIRPAEYPLESA